MARITRYGRRLRRMLLSSMTAACFTCLFAVPFVQMTTQHKNVGCYSIAYNGTIIGMVDTLSEAEKVVAEARKLVNSEFDEIVYLDSMVDIVKEDKLSADRISIEDAQNKLYEEMLASAVEKQDSTCYTVRIDDFTVTLSSKDEVVELMQKVASKYDTNNIFQVSLKEGHGIDGEYEIDMVRSSINENDKDTVSSSATGSSVETKEESAEDVQGITGIHFQETISVSETLKTSANVLTVEEAYEAITKEKAEKTTYIVVEGDTLTAIAQKCNINLSDIYNMNSNLSKESIIIPGDEVVVTVPKAEISVVVVTRETYEESYNAEVQYVDNNNAYRGVNKVVNGGSAGFRQVTADVTYVNGVKTSVDVVTQNVIKEAVPKVISVGTLTPPTYLRPVTGGGVSLVFGSYYKGMYHKGIDWTVPTGTPVRAACGGVVTISGWLGGGGYMIEIKHPDGNRTRYLHLNECIVKVGQYVSQSQLIAYSGSTGIATGPHLHFEVVSPSGQSVNPLNYVNKY